MKKTSKSNEANEASMSKKWNLSLDLWDYMILHMMNTTQDKNNLESLINTHNPNYNPKQATDGSNWHKSTIFDT